LFYSDDQVLAHVEQRRQQLLDEAYAHRQVRCAQAARRVGLRRSDRLLYATGAWLVRWGMYLQQRGRISSTAYVDTRPA
jgi:hypothetical protein